MDFTERQNSEIDHIIFGILSAEEIMRMSVCHVTSSKPTGPDSVHDERMGAMKNNEICVTCGKNCKLCPGHFGHIELIRPVVHPLYYKNVCSFLNCFCFHCHNLLLSPEYLELNGLLYLSGNGRFKGILERVQKLDICTAKLTCKNPTVNGGHFCVNHCKKTELVPEMEGKILFPPDNPESENTTCSWTGTCGKAIPEFKHCSTDSTFVMSSKKKDKKKEKTPQTTLSTDDIKKTFDNIPDSDVRMLGFDPSRIHPRNLILTVFPVIPPIDRPYVIQGPEGKVCDDDLTSTIVELIKANNQLKRGDLREDKALKAEQTVNFRIATFINNEPGKARHTNGRPVKGLTERMKGKDGLIRNNLMGKRVDKSGRTVIGGDPTLRVGEMVIPTQIARNLTMSERVCDYNYEELQDIVNRGEANFVLRKNCEIRINLRYALFRKGTELLYGDVILRDGKELKYEHGIKRKMFLEYGDRIIRNGKKVENVRYPQKKNFPLKMGDIVERHMRNGDIVLLNRQPTLHAGSMMAMRVIVREGKTFRLPLAVTKSYNGDKHCLQQGA